MALNDLAQVIMLDELTDVLSTDESEFLLANISPNTLPSVKQGQISPAGALRLKESSWQSATAAARLCDDADTLARIARHPSVRVRRVVAENEHLNHDTIKYLWKWAIRKNDAEILIALAKQVDLETAVDYISTHRDSHGGERLLRQFFKKADRRSWPALLAATERQENHDGSYGSRSSADAIAAAVNVAAENDHSLCALYEDTPVRLRPAMAQVAVKCVSIDDDVLDMVRKFKTEFPDLDLTYRYVYGVSDDMMVRLFETDPTAVNEIQLSTSNIRAITWVAERAFDYPNVARDMLLSRETSKHLPGPLFEEVLDVTEKKHTSYIHAMTLSNVSPYRMSSDSVLSVLRHQMSAVGEPTLDWLLGKYPHQLPTDSEIVALFNDPEAAFGRSRYRTVHRTASEFFGAVGSEARCALLGMPWANTLVDALGSEWRVLVSAHGGGDYLLSRIHREVGVGSDALRTSLTMLDKSTTGMTETFRAIRAVVNNPITITEQPEIEGQIGLL